MSGEDSTDKPKKRLSRLKAMQDRHAAGQPAAASAAVAGFDPGEDLEGFAPSQGEAAGGGGGAAKGGRGGAMMQKLRQALSKPDGGIDQQKARRFLMLVRKQAADPSAPRHELAKRIAERIKALPPQQRQRLMAAAGLAGGGDIAAAGAGPGMATARTQAAAAEAGGEAWFDNLIDKL